ncbi:DUF58 domain-containing protein [Leifsonia poae]|uniref:DUF58 domain-containing protein n=1 Tax=Leifsonia poae TaxID=110933 RepID=UPI001CBED176|nr:DUF58 domain-containing protein [Leifsonia poae]
MTGTGSIPETSAAVPVGESDGARADGGRLRRFRARWSLSPAVVAAVVVGLLCLVVGFVTARVDLALVGAPLLVAAAVAWDRRPPEQMSIVVGASAEAVPGRRVQTTVSIGSDARPDAVELRLEIPGREPVEVVVSARAAQRIVSHVPVVRTGPQRFVGAGARVIGIDASSVSEATPPTTADRVIPPRAIPVRSLPLPARLIGLTGPHASGRPGDGGEFRDVDRFAPGDRLRRIDWKATARRAQLPGELYVRRTMATSDAAVHFVMDSRDDVTGRVSEWPALHPGPGVGSQDLAREAVASLASAYAAAGDRVGFDDLANATRGIQPRGGTRHLQRVLRSVAVTGPSGAATERVRPPIVVPGALVFVLSTFLDEQSLRLALVWRAAGHRVIAVDVLPTLHTGDLPGRDLLALRVVELERKLRFRRLAAAGIDLLAWQDAGGERREARLRELSRPRRMR